MDYYSISILINILIEIFVGILVFYIISKLILIPGNKKLQNVTDIRGYTEKIREIKRARLLLSVCWIIIILIINLLMIIL